jgi:hypothetical protein
VVERVHLVARPSGYGRELSDLGMYEFANRKLICAVAPDAPVRGFEA